MTLTDSSGAPITCSNWDELVAEDGFLALGRNRYHCSFLVYEDGTYIYAENGTTGELDYGGPNNQGGVSGTDASAVIQAALTNLTAARTWKEKVVIKGEFTIPTRLEVFSNTVVELNGVLTLDDNVNAHIIRVNTGYFDVVIRGGRLEGNSAGQTAGSGILIQQDCYNVIIDGIIINDCFDSGIRITGAVAPNHAYNLTITNNTVTNCNDGIYPSNVRDSIISSNICHDNDRNGINAGPITRILISDNVLSDNTRHGINLEPGIHCTVSNNTAYSNTERGIQLNGATFCTVIGNECNENGHSGIYLITACEDNIVKGNVCKDNDYANTATWDGITIGTNCARTIVIGNRCQDNDDAEINVYASGTFDNILMGNILFGSDRQFTVQDQGIRTHIFHNPGLETPFSLTGTDTHLPTVKGGFPLSNISGGATTTAPVINTSPGGVDLDANDEFCYVHITLPQDLHEIVRIKIWAYSNVIEADAMRLRIVSHAATDNEAWSGNAVDVADHPSESTNFAADDVIHWLIDSGDDAQIGTMTGQDLVELMAVGEAAGGADAATDALFGGWEIEYV